VIIRGLIVAAVLGLGAGVSFFMSGANVAAGKVTVGTTVPPSGASLGPAATLYIPAPLPTTTTTKPNPVHILNKSVNKTVSKTVNKAGASVTKTITKIGPPHT
jgi:hypothetical protein